MCEAFSLADIEEEGYGGDRFREIDEFLTSDNNDPDHIC